LWCLFFFLLICVVFSGRLQLPTAFKVLGRLHPLVIHFPLVLSILISCLFLVPRWRHNLMQEQSQESLYYLLGLNAFFGIISALFGIFLSREGGYDAQSLQWHKWSGIFLACFSYVFFLGFKQVLQAKTCIFCVGMAFPNPRDIGRACRRKHHARFGIHSRAHGKGEATRANRPGQGKCL
jgi:uncharacterized membrane protein